MKRRMFSLLLVMVMVLGMLPTIAFAAPTESSGVYQIGTAEELLWFAQEVNGGNTGISGVLTADIDMSAYASWPGIGTNHKPFSGSFDGQGHMVTFRNAMWGMFGFVAGKSGAIVTIQNVKTAGSVQRSPIAHDVTFTHIIGCINGATVTKANENYVGGIVGSVRYSSVGTTYYNDVLIQNCGNVASITANDYVGGIMGSACYVNTRIEGCYNTGNIHGGTYVGGIVGWHQSYEGSNHIKNSYNTGRVTGRAAVAGIAGHLNNGVTVQNCYNAGASTYAIIGRQYNATNVLSNTYFLGTASAKSVPDYTTYESQEPVYRGTAKTAADMASADFAALLGDAYKESCPYPVLSWQTATAHTGSVCNNCQLGSTEKEYYDVSFQQHAGYTLNGESKATQGQAYSFTITISEGYEKIAGFAVKVNGKEVTPASDGKYTVMNVQEPLSITVRNVQVIPGNHVISLPGAGYGYTITGEKSAKRDEDYTFNLTFVDGFKAGTEFKVMAQEIVPQSELDNGVFPEEITLTGNNGTFTIPNVQKDYRILVSGVVAVPTVAPVTVNFTVTEGWYEFHEPNDSGEVIIDKTLTVPYFDLSLYGLEKYYYNPYCYLDEDGNIRNIQQKGTPETAYNNITAMHAFIVATELFYLGYSQDQVGTGRSCREMITVTDYKGEQVTVSKFANAISWSQDAGSSFMNFWDHGTNLNYYINYAYPLAYTGWGSTSDQEVIKNGDVISVHLITGVGSGSNFGFFTANDTNNKYNPGTDVVNEITVDQGEKVKLTYFWTATSGNYSTSYKLQKNKQLYWINTEEDGIPGRVEPYELEDEDGNPYYEGGWRNEPLGKNMVLKTDSNGVVTIDTAGLEPGTYYIGGIGGFEKGGGADNAGFVSAGSEAGASFFKIVVQEYQETLDVQLEFHWMEKGVTPRTKTCDPGEETTLRIKNNQLSAGAIPYELKLTGADGESGRILSVAYTSEAGDSGNLEERGSLALSMPEGATSNTYHITVTAMVSGQRVTFVIDLYYSADLSLQMEYTVKEDGVSVTRQITCENTRSKTAEAIYDDQLTDGTLAYTMSLVDAEETVSITSVTCYQSGSGRTVTIGAQGQIALLLKDGKTGENTFEIEAQDNSGNVYHFTVNIPYKHRGENNIKIETNLVDGQQIINETKTNLTVRAWSEDANGNVISYIPANGTDTKLIVTLDGEVLSYVSSSGAASEYDLYPKNPEVGDTNTHELTIYAEDALGNYGELTLTLMGERRESGQKIGNATIYVDMTALGLGVVANLSYEVLADEPVSYVIAKAIMGKDTGEPFGAAANTLGWGGRYAGTLDSGFYLQSLTTGHSANALEGGTWPGATEAEVLAAIDARFGAGTGLATLWRCLYRNGLNKSTGSGGSFGEFDYTSGSGWMYSVGGSTYYPGQSMSSVYLQDGDVLIVRYTLAYGWDVGGGSSGYGSTVGYCVSAVNGSIRVNHRMETITNEDGSQSNVCHCCGIVEDCAHANVVFTDLGDGTHIQYCDDCKKEVGDPAQHSWVYTGEDSDLNHSCAECGVVEEHNWKEVEGSNTATCVDPGKHSVQCVICNMIKEEETGPKGHTLDNKWQVTAAEHYELCSTCGERANQGRHQYKHITYTENGVQKETYECKICSAWHVDECSGTLTETRTTCQKITYHCNGCGYDMDKEGFFDEHHHYVGGSCEYCGEADPNGGSTEPPETEPPETEPPETEPPETEPPETEPPTTEPPATEPPETEPPQTDPPATDPPPEPEPEPAPQPEEGGGDPGEETT